jgi:type IV pilus assembly protein PilB
MTNSRVRLGELLIEAQIITREQLDAVLAQQKQDPRRLGTLLTDAGLLTETQVTQILSQQLSVPWVSLYHIDFSRQLLDLVPEQLATEHCLVPIFVRKVRGQGNTLYIAMDDPSDEHALTAVQQYSGLPVRAMIAPPSDIAAAINAYYGHGVGLTPSMIPAAKSSRPVEVAEMSRASGSEAFSTLQGSASHGSATGGLHPSVRPQRSFHPPEAPAVLEPVPDSSPLVDVRELGMPKPKKGNGRKMVTLTLLDGTQVALPARRPKATAPTEAPVSDADHLTTRDIVLALRAKLHGQDASEVLGDNGRWEALVAALIVVMLKKHLIADWEFIEELKRL